MPPATDKTLPRWAQALVQATSVALFLLLVHLGVYQLHRPLVISCLGASAFIAFGFPSAASARPRILLGGYACGIVFGTLCSLLYQGLDEAARAGTAGILSLCAAAFLAAFFMILLGVQHPPAVAFAVAAATDASPLTLSLWALAAVVLLCGLQWAERKYLGRFFPPPA